ncbi:pantoate/beta-alanine ligase [Anaeromyxobacter sp. K]|uniref:Pantothenate synthetase n=1 Tax=Anaeromyxobacter dehalogenans (strain ATCC BAA-258 / DSM 21875 / 2CP-1) TaxID=455488 RepID=B8J7G6_ANAD2|nr:pantoate/beta-alanine ligase [Anaeromyxobacter sp. K]ACL67146.1 pantoate/beta-alanine ligase [Anaeromyxobacter dehalogenans 2CP-1]
MKTTELITDPASWQARCTAAREAGTRIALVTTMGYLHEGHLSLMREARRRADEGGRRGLAVGTIFVNPTQFGPTEDLARYPRDLEGDLAKCAAAGLDAVLAPSDPALMFAPGHETWVTVERASQGLDGASRPGHFRGVATVVAKLFNLTRPHVALFGEKDWQQVAVIRAMVRDLAFGIEIVGMPIVREPDGLALSSRNAYLSPDERRRALALSGALAAAREATARGERDAASLRAGARARLEAAGGRVDYVEIVHPETLAPVARAEPGSVLLLAAWFGATRLIDNGRLP